jgi:GDP-L-fucose synthase
LANSHVIPALLRKFYEARKSGQPEVVIWGSGEPRREFLRVDDLAAAAVFLMRQYNEPELVNVGTGADVTIRELAETIQRVSGFEGGITFDRSKFDGTSRKLLDVGRIEALGWRPSIALEGGIAETWRWYCANLSGPSPARGRLSSGHSRGGIIIVPQVIDNIYLTSGLSCFIAPEPTGA